MSAPTTDRLHVYCQSCPHPTACAHRPSQHTRQKKISLKLSTIALASRHFQPQNPQMENTRVFVSGLPPTCSNDQLRNHFASRFQVTDAHVLPKRRMGFVGFKSNEVAQDAVKHFNRTYMKMSRISVDLARPVCEVLRCRIECFCLFPACTLTRSVGLETDQYYCRLVPRPLRRLIPHEDVMLPMTPRITHSSARGMRTARHKTLNCRSISL